MIEVTLKFESMADAARFFNGSTVENIATPAPTSNATLPVTLQEQVDMAPVKKAKTKKTEGVDSKSNGQAGHASSSPVASEPEQKSDAEQKPVTIDDVRKALGDYVARTDFAKGTAFVASFNKEDGTPCSRLTEIQAADYADFLNKAGAL